MFTKIINDFWVLPRMKREYLGRPANLGLLISNNTQLGWFAFLILLLVLMIIALKIEYFVQDRSNDILTEMWGLLGDVLLFAVLMSFIKERLDRKQNLRRYKDEIDSIRSWQSLEASYRHWSNVKKLNDLSEYDIDLSECYLGRPKQSEISALPYSNRNVVTTFDLFDGDLSGATLANDHFKDCRWDRPQLWGLKIISCIFDECKIVPDNTLLLLHKCVFKKCRFDNNILYFLSDEEDSTVFDSCVFNNESLHANTYNSCSKRIRFLHCTFTYLHGFHMSENEASFVGCTFSNCRINDDGKLSAAIFESSNVFIDCSLPKQLENDILANKQNTIQYSE